MGEFLVAGSVLDGLRECSLRGVFLGMLLCGVECEGEEGEVEDATSVMSASGSARP